MMNESLKLHGELTLILEKANGDIQVVNKSNIIVNTGFDFVCDAIGNAGSRPLCMSHIAVGTDTPEPEQAALTAELSRLAAVYSHTPNSKTFTFTTTFEPGTATGAITEAGVFNAASGGIMLDRVTFAVINKGEDDTFTAIFQFTLS